MAISTLTMKPTRHEMVSITKPPRTCPTTADMPEAAAQVPTAAPLSFECGTKDGQRSRYEARGTESLNRPRGD